MKARLLLAPLIIIFYGFAAFGRLINTPFNQYAFRGQTLINFSIPCSSTLGSNATTWFFIPVGDSTNYTVASGSTVYPEFTHLYWIEQRTIYDSNLIMYTVDDSTAGTYTCADKETIGHAQMIVLHNLIPSTDASDNLLIGDVIRYTCQLVYVENPFFVPIFTLARSSPLERLDNTTSPQLENSNSLITATATFYQTVSCLSFLNMQCLLKFGEPVGNLLPGSATNAPNGELSTGFSTPKVSCLPTITGAVSGDALYFGGMLSCQLTVDRPVNYSWTDLTYGNSSIGPQLTIWHSGSYQCMASINSSGTWSTSAKVISNLTVENLSSTAKPLYGPIAGGTKVTLTLENWSKQSSNLSAVYFGDMLKVTDLQSDRSSNSVVMTTSPAITTLIGEPLPMTIEFTPGPYNISTKLSFTYQDNPEITDISPSTFVFTGGTAMNVTGIQLSSVANPFIEVTILVERGIEGNTTSERSFQPCEVKAGNGSHMICRMPAVNIPDDFLQILDSLYISGYTRETPFQATRRKRYVNALSLSGPNGEDRLVIFLGFILDGYEKYKNVNDFLPNAEILIFSPPEISFTKHIIDFDPSKDESISIEGKYMTRGCRLSDYVVQVGSDVCENIDVTDNQLRCRPPKQQPLSTQNGSFNCDQHLSVQVHLGFKTYQYACMKYSERFPILIIGLAVGLSSFIIVILLIITVVCCCKRFRNRRDKSTEIPLDRNVVAANEPPSAQLYSNAIYLRPSDQSYAKQEYEPPSYRLPADEAYLRPTVQSLYARDDRETSSDQLYANASELKRS